MKISFFSYQCQTKRLNKSTFSQRIATLIIPIRANCIILKKDLQKQVLLVVELTGFEPVISTLPV